MTARIREVGEVPGVLMEEVSWRWDFEGRWGGGGGRSLIWEVRGEYWGGNTEGSIIANIILGKEPNAHLSYFPGLEDQHPIMSILLELRGW